MPKTADEIEQKGDEHNNNGDVSQRGSCVDAACTASAWAIAPHVRALVEGVLVVHGDQPVVRVQGRHEQLSPHSCIEKQPTACYEPHEKRWVWVRVPDDSCSTPVKGYAHTVASNNGDDGLLIDWGQQQFDNLNKMRPFYFYEVKK